MVPALYILFSLLFVLNVLLRFIYINSSSSFILTALWYTIMWIYISSFFNLLKRKKSRSLLPFFNLSLPKFVWAQDTISLILSKPAYGILETLSLAIYLIVNKSKGILVRRQLTLCYPKQFHNSMWIFSPMDFALNRW